MTLEEAIRNLRTIIKFPKTPITYPEEKAVKLGIEGLKLIQRERVLGINPVETQLPGEAEE